MEGILLSGTVQYGKHLGTTLGFPTANLNYDTRPFPGIGVYAGYVCLDGETWPCILNCGVHPTAPLGPPTIEVHLLGYTGPSFYGKEIKVLCGKYLRAEKRFQDLEALKKQLTEDKKQGLEWAEENPFRFE